MHRVRVIRNKKAWIRLVEVALATALLFGYMTYLQQIQMSDVQKPSWDPVILKSYGEDALRSYDMRDMNWDYKSDLRTDLLDGDWDTMGNEINDTLPQDVMFSLYMYTPHNDSTTHVTGPPEQQIPDDIDKVTVWYVIAGESGNYCNGGICALKMTLGFMK